MKVSSDAPFEGFLFHGTGDDFESLDPGQAGKVTDSGFFGAGTSLTPHPKLAEAYARGARSLRGTDQAKLLTVDVKLSKPLYATNDDLTSRAAEALGHSWKDIPWSSPREMTSMLKDKGFDGIVVLSKDGTAQEVTVFQSGAMKIASKKSLDSRADLG